MHIRYNFPQRYNQSSPSLDAIEPLAFVDKVTARIKVARLVRIKGRNVKANFTPNWRWINHPNGKVGVWANGLDNEVFVNLNPSTLNNRYNIFPYRGDVVSPLRMVLPYLLDEFRDFPLLRPEMILIRGGYSELTGIHVTGDFEFSSRQKLKNCIRELQTRWKGKRTRNPNDNYAMALYLNHTHWTLCAYCKDDEIEKNHADWPDAVKRHCRNRLRIEIKLRRQELLKLGTRLKRRYPDLPLLDLSRAGDWEPNIYPLVFDLYVSRVVPRWAQKRVKGSGARPPFYGLVASHGGLPVYPRGNQADASYYKARGPGKLIAHHNLLVRTDPYADHHQVNR